ncbi:Uncharacterized protein DBV15_00925 [Temnothorax longispinosus]|uniref:Dexamethasone-induced Ras-related protein 1 n=1 Tax=Temnothorax longispinosus TaxID=300112 RepID=A0A4S2JBU1_9HYME|nr:Uncharacterized protein DBV15_00925 [Temnothorax longispinosus]
MCPHLRTCNSRFLQLEACGRLLCCVQRLCRSGSATDEPAEHRINARGRRGAQAEPELVEGQGPSGPEDGMLAMPVSPSPASTSSQEDACKPPPRNCYRLVMLGSARVGKTAIVARFLFNKFEESYTPTIEDFHRKLYRIRGEIHQLDLLDTSGNHPFPAMRRLSFLTAFSVVGFVLRKFYNSRRNLIPSTTIVHYVLHTGKVRGRLPGRREV